MLYNKRPLIYIPKKKKIVESAPAPTPVQASTAIRVLTQYLKYPNNQHYYINNWQYPAMIEFNPTTIGFSISGKQHTSTLVSGTRYSTLIVPIVEQSGNNMVTIANGMRWAPVAPDTLTSSAGESLSVAFFIGSSTPFGAVVLKIKDSTPTQSDPYILNGVMIRDEAIPGMSTPQFYYRKLYDPNSVVGRIRTALNNTYGSSVGTLIFTDVGYSLWNNATLLSFANYYAGALYGTKTSVADLLI